MDIRVGTRDEHAVLTPSGRVDLLGARDLRTALLKAAAEDPDAIVCDLTALVTDTAASLTLFLTVADDVAQWPSCTIVLVAPQQRLRDQLVAVGVDRRFPVVAAEADVAAALRRRPAARAALRLRAELGAPARARAFVAACVRDWVGDPADAPDPTVVALIVDELVTNAVLHTGTPVDVLVSLRSGVLRVAVADGSPQAPLARNADRDDENGRGLALVTALTRAWGVLGRGVAGKVVWAVVDAQPVGRPVRAAPPGW